MGLPVKGDIVVIPFPFSDLSSIKRRPALVIAPVSCEDLILCQITSKYHADNYSIPLRPSDLITGTLKDMSYIRPEKLFTADVSMIQYTLGHISDPIMQTVVNTIVSIIQKD
ncbi:type II toxin-antitoxin system PemK/MazF family toxin [Methanospirillum sp. J.3.6.1-F.2.7.3]|uniref:Type II toxin-antitoxin system PemK/MazF family toxin n=2 Tax=Methanospirillum TaxID=2202 RepID=A0A8E7AV26_9EURY|nr:MULTISPECIES: type II toxin-antitoxin system PemK/MazF family toxin [Methanospirillum]MDX8550376.1 type II toxin-antitoxin system PemK/MazF family toxin [Methanospirillum hungatei]QVV88072.1 type II toxin-antitoxin system PemK/MazF family toxin [Methanospirillum sp. J.3.6.1-F.2.7.3]QXO95541.1 type II toxin-antitoxin system PemK/MazF family toxin [Methanospirillum hungatei]